MRTHNDPATCTPAQHLAVAEHRRRLGLNEALRFIGFSKSSHYWSEGNSEPPRGIADRDEPLVDAIRAVIQSHPGYGWRRIQSEIAEEHDIAVNHKRIKRVLSDYQLGLRRQIVKKHRSGPADILALHAGNLDLVTGNAFGASEVLSTDFTEYYIAAGAQKVWLMANIDIESRLVTGWSIDLRRHTDMAL